MLACALCAVLFVYWWAIGHAVVRALHASRSRLQDVLLAVPVGVVVTVLPVFTINRLGVPVRRFGVVVGLVLPLLAAGLWWWTRRREAAAARGDLIAAPAGETGGIPWRRVWPFALVLLIGFVASARPMYTFGFDWLSYCNDDMANYCLAADRFYNEGYFDFPQPENILYGQYWADDYWFMHVLAANRPGCELLLSFVMSVTGLNAHHAFMPTIVALHMGLIASVGAMVLQPGWLPRRRRPHDGDADADGPVVRRDTGDDENFAPALVASLLVSISALTTLGLMYQLIAQVLGLSLLCVMAVMLLRTYDGFGVRRVARHGLLVAVMGAGVLVIYPECCPFLGLSFFVYMAVGLARRRVKVWQVALVILIGGIGAAVLLRVYAYHSILFMLNQASAAKTDAGNMDPNNTLFPYFMLPKGLADLWGLQRVAGWKVRPWLMDWSIGIGAVLTAVTIVCSVWLAGRGRPEAIIALVMFGLAVSLFRNRAGFGLFKLAMYLQPFILATVVTAWFTLTRRRERAPATEGDAPDAAAVAYVPVRQPLWRIAFVQALPLLLFGVVGLRAQTGYVVSSYGVGTSFMEIPDPSRSRVNAEFAQLVQKSGSDRLVSDTFNLVLAKFQSVYTRGRELVFPSNRFLRLIDSHEATVLTGRFIPERQAELVRALQAERRALMPQAFFDLKDPQDPKLRNRFYVNDLGYCLPGRWENYGTGGAAATTRPSTLPATTRPATGPKMERGTDPPLLVMSTGRQSMFNRRYFPPERATNFTTVPLAEARDLLVFIASDLGQPYYFGGTKYQVPAIYQMEEEPHDTPFFRGATMCGIGRYAMVQAINPSERVRMVVELTASYKADGENQLPPNMAVVGKERVPFAVTGRGSGRFFSPPVDPQEVLGRAYYMYDMGDQGRRFPMERTGLMRWFGTDVAIDRRVLVGFLRDVSLISEEGYASLKPPSKLFDFTYEHNNPLRNRELEYSGMYEDGWVGEDAYWRLSQPAGGEAVVRGTVPLVGDNAAHALRAVLSVDGVQVAETTGTPGQPFVLRGPAPVVTAGAATQPASPNLPTPPMTRPVGGAGDPVRTVRLQFFGPIPKLNPPDSRPAAAQLSFVGFEPAEPVARK